MGKGGHGPEPYRPSKEFEFAMAQLTKMHRIDQCLLPPQGRSNAVVEPKSVGRSDGNPATAPSPPSAGRGEALLIAEVFDDLERGYEIEFVALAIGEHIGDPPLNPRMRVLLFGDADTLGRIINRLYSLHRRLLGHEDIVIAAATPDVEHRTGRDVTKYLPDFKTPRRIPQGAPVRLPIPCDESVKECSLVLPVVARGSERRMSHSREVRQCAGGEVMRFRERPRSLRDVRH